MEFEINLNDIITYKGKKYRITATATRNSKEKTHLTLSRIKNKCSKCGNLNIEFEIIHD